MRIFTSLCSRASMQIVLGREPLVVGTKLTCRAGLIRGDGRVDCGVPSGRLFACGPPKPVKRLNPGDVLDDRFVIVGLIGEGGMGAVYSARQIGLERLVAIKVLHLTAEQSEDDTTRFLREGLILSKLNHENVPVFYHFGVMNDGSPFMAFEFLQGCSLREKIANGPLAWRDTVVLAIEVCQALACAHSEGIIHRDIKPENIFICSPNENVKVIDFGLSTFSQNLQLSQSLTHTGMLIGSVSYMSPEQCRGQHLTGGTDLYSLACVMFESMTGEPVFQCDNPIGMMHKHVNEPPPAVSSSGRDIPEELDHLVLKALSKDPNDRFQSAMEMSSALEAVLDLKVAKTRAQSRPWFAFKKVILVMVAAFLLMAVLLVGTPGGAQFVYSAGLGSEPANAIVLARLLTAMRLDNQARNLLVAAVMPDRTTRECSASEKFEAASVLAACANRLDRYHSSVIPLALNLVREGIAQENDASAHLDVDSTCVRIADAIERGNGESALAIAAVEPTASLLFAHGYGDSGRALILSALKVQSKLTPSKKFNLSLQVGNSLEQDGSFLLAKCWYERLANSVEVEDSTNRTEALRHVAVCALACSDFESLDKCCLELLRDADAQRVSLVCDVLCYRCLLTGDRDLALAYAKQEYLVSRECDSRTEQRAIVAQLYAMSACGMELPSAREIWNVVRKNQVSGNVGATTVTAAAWIARCNNQESRAMLMHADQFKARARLVRDLLLLYCGGRLDVESLRSEIIGLQEEVNLGELLSDFQFPGASGSTRSNQGEFSQNAANLVKVGPSNRKIDQLAEIGKVLRMLRNNQLSDARALARDTVTIAWLRAGSQLPSSLLPLVIPLVYRDGASPVLVKNAPGLSESLSLTAIDNLCKQRKLYTE